jgi:uncharacterized protein YndB with AHSA1/START domain
VTGRGFEIERAVMLPASPEQVFAAVTTGTAGWMFPTELSPAVGGTGPDDPTVRSWEPPHEFRVRLDGEDGWFNALEYVIEARDGGTSVLRYVHSGVFTDDWDDQYDGARLHTDFYLHTLGQYLAHFAGRPTTYVQASGPVAATAPDAFARLRAHLGEPALGDEVRLEVPDLEPVTTAVDWANENFLGLRGPGGLYRFFGRNAWGAPVGMSLHLFDSAVDPDKAGAACARWLGDLYA